ncbi:hypothetical protein LPY66_07025 [Dehalobacter sp. DCM]|uniref:hypothetical protein n=1 Tax=Dehalobacter sp. DCM TaxID=2907827 RepID=UPI003081A6CF|nr:hypothetical protein LPY66_07025 [Dehalobacter sp. DCM]
MAVIMREYVHKLTAKIKQKEKVISAAAFLMFIVFALITGLHHEPWTDEAQSWLIARDTNWTQLFSVMAYEGSPALWPIVLKIFISFGLEYQNLFIVPLIFSTLGVWLLIYKSDFPLLIRVFLPFTYYIFYQYTIVARSYSLILPCIQLIVLFYKDRLRKPYIFGILLIVLSGISVHAMILSGILFLFYCWDILKIMKANAPSRQIIANSAVVGVIALSYLLTVSYLIPPADLSFVAAKFDWNLLNIITRFCVLIGEALIFNTSTMYSFIVMGVIAAIFALVYQGNGKFYIICTSICLFLSCFYCNKWHIGLIFLSFLLALQLFSPTLKAKDTRIRYAVYVLIGIVFCVQISWGIRTATYDCRNSHSGAYAAAEFIKENRYDQTRIYGLGYCSTAIEPYFNTNIYKNRTTAYYLWSLNNGDLTNQQIVNNLPDVVVYSEFDSDDYTDITAMFIRSGYRSYSFTGATFIKDSVYETQTYTVFVRDNKDIEKTDIKTGMYVGKPYDIASSFMPIITLENNNKFTFELGIGMAIEGSYTQDENKITFNAADGERYVFGVSEEKLIIEQEIPKRVRQNTVFKYSPSCDELLGKN